MEEDIILKVKKSGVLDIVNLILKLYTLFLFFFALIIQSDETVIQTGFMLVVIIVFEFLNDSEIEITKKGVRTTIYGFTRWRDLDRFDIYKTTIVIKPKEERAKKIVIDLKEDKRNIANASKYVESKMSKYEINDD